MENNLKIINWYVYTSKEKTKTYKKYVFHLEREMSKLSKIGSAAGIPSNLSQFNGEVQSS